ncbi:protein FAM90A27P [Ictidomys tridecemlineatus]
MDPNTLSMEQGRQFLKQCGIPQRDIDALKEKWMIVASVEVLLRFPLRPGEDPAAHCVTSGKYQPLVDRSHTISHRGGEHKEGKSNNQLMSKTEQKPRAVTQVSGVYTHFPPQGAAKDKNLKKRQRGLEGQWAPQPEEEVTVATCKDCGASGHNPHSLRCPGKCCDQALSWQPLDSNKDKENLKPRKPQPLRGQDEIVRREKNPGQRQEEQQRKALPQKLPKRSSDEMARIRGATAGSPVPMRKPCRPLPVLAPKRRHAPDPILRGPPAGKTVDLRTLGPAWSHNKNPQLSSIGAAQGHESHSKHPSRDSQSSSRPVNSVVRSKPKKLKSFQSPQVTPPATPNTRELAPKPAPKATTKVPSWKPTVDLQPLFFSPGLSPVQGSTVFLPLTSSHTQGKPTESGSMRRHKGQPSPRLSLAPTGIPSVKSPLAAPRPRVWKESEDLAPCVPRSVLYEDLLVSSFSEDSD